MSDLPTDPAELGRYVVTRPWWRWMPGMLAVSPSSARFRLAKDEGGVVWRRVPPLSSLAGDSYAAPDTPDLTDAATVGCLLALAEELAGGPVDVTHVNPPEAFWQACTAVHPSTWEHRGQETDGPFAPTRAHALVGLCDTLADGGAS